MTKAENPRRIVNAGARIAEALGPKQLKLLIDLVQSAQATSSGHDAGTLSITLAKLKHARKIQVLSGIALSVERGAEAS